MSSGEWPLNGLGLFALGLLLINRDSFEGVRERTFLKLLRTTFVTIKVSLSLSSSLSLPLRLLLLFLSWWRGGWLSRGDESEAIGFIARTIGDLISQRED